MTSLRFLPVSDTASGELLESKGLLGDPATGHERAAQMAGPRTVMCRAGAGRPLGAGHTGRGWARPLSAPGWSQMANTSATAVAAKNGIRTTAARAFPRVSGLA